MRKLVVALSLLIFIVVNTYGIYRYSQLYTQNTESTAVSGVIFKNTLNLLEYKNVASGNNLLGNFNIYSRSDRQVEVTKVYCKEFCK